LLTSLTIKNYALIDNLQVDFNKGLTIITGETGAGKSILLGGLSLILGKRADLSSLKDTSQKCIIEAVFDIANYNLKSLFKAENLDFETQTIIRREILPSGKSRAFVNDSPIKLSSLQVLGERLIDIHSQHQTLQLVNDNYQFQVIDVLADNEEELKNYKTQLNQYKIVKKELEDLVNFQVEANKEQDYNSYLLKEFNEANLTIGELVLLEEEYETLNNIEEIKEKLTASQQILNNDEIGVINNLSEVKSLLSKLSNYTSNYKDVFERVNSSLIELDDILNEVTNLQEQLLVNPNRLDEVNKRLQVINNLMQKHNVNQVFELIDIEKQLKEKIFKTENLEYNIKKKENEIVEMTIQLNSFSEAIHHKREIAIPELSNQLEHILESLGMPNAQFDIQLKLGDVFLNNGKDELSFLFSANKGGNFNELKKAASGGELSRIMLAIKSILSNYIQLPTIMFDEIDSGVSGEISNKMGDIMLQMSNKMQVFTITHLPQIAAKGHTHYKVYKEDVNNITRTDLVKLNQDDRIVEIAQMLGGIAMSTSAIAHAKELLN